MDYPTSPDVGLLNRAMRPDMSALLGSMSGVLDRMVDFGTHVFLWCGPEAGQNPAYAPPLMLLYHAIEMADATSILLRRGSLDPCGPLLRSLIEATISAFYILQADTERRGLAYRYGNFVAKATALERLDPSTAKGKEVIRRISTDKTMGGTPPPIDASQVAAEMANVKAKMANALFAEVSKEWNRLEIERRRPQPWHALFDGPGNVAELAEDVGCAGWYDVFYRQFSDEVHSTSAMESLRKDSKASKALIRPLRYPEHATNCLGLCGTLLIRLYDEMLKRFSLSHKPVFDDWYKTTMSKDFMELIDVKIVAPKA